MSCVLFPKVDQVFSLKNKNIKNTGKMGKNTGKFREKSGNFVSPKKWEPCPNLKFLSESWQNIGFAVHSLYRNPECATGIKPKLYPRFVTCVQLLRIYLLLLLLKVLVQICESSRCIGVWIYGQNCGWFISPSRYGNTFLRFAMRNFQQELVTLCYIQ